MSAGIASNRCTARSAASSASRRALLDAVRQPHSRRRRGGRPRSGRGGRARRRRRATPAAPPPAPRRPRERHRPRPQNSAPVFSRCSAARSAVVAVDVAVLAADHPERRLRELAPDHRSRVREREPECLGEQRVARQERRRLAESDVRRRAAPPLVVVVHRGQVVVHERERVHELHCGGGRAGNARRPLPAASLDRKRR